jgi:hypothetical protein
MKDVTSIVTTATGKIFVCEFVGKGGHTTKENIARIMRERPHCWRLRLNAGDERLPANNQKP